MSLNALNELKRRLEDDSTSLPKRLRLAKNVIHSTHFPAAPKERIVAEWLETITERNCLSSKDIRDVIGWLHYADDLTNDLKFRLVKVISQYLHSNPPKNSDLHFIVKFLENDKISTSLKNQVDDYLFITTTLLQNLRNSAMSKHTLCQKLLLNLIKYYKECKKKLEFVIKLIDGENLETLFSYLNSEYRSTVLNVCQNILFPITKKSFFVSFLQNLIWKDNLDELIAEKGDNIQSVIKILSAFFVFPKGRTVNDHKFLTDFVDIFVSCYHNESQIIFAFYIMAFSSLNMNQNYLIPAMKMPTITFEQNDEKTKRKIFLKMLKILVMNEVDTSVKLTNTLGENATKVEIKKNFMSFLQVTMLRLLKLEGKPDKLTLQIITSAIKLDPSMIEQKLDVILPSIMTAKKTSNTLQAYIEMLNCLIETLFKLSKGTLFINQILNYIKFKLEAINIEQFDLRQKLIEDVDGLENIKNKMITGNDILPGECVEVYGKWTSELMFRQNASLLTSLQKDLEENCLMMLEEGFVSPSIITLTEILSAILSSFFRNSKMADHTVPQPIAEEFWSSFNTFQDECLKKFGECILKLNYNPPLILAFLKLCLSYSQLKLINLKYVSIKVKEIQVEPTDVLDCSAILPCLNSNQWCELAQIIQDDEAVIVWDNLLLVKSMAIELLNIKNTDITQSEVVKSTRTHLIKKLTENPDAMVSVTFFTRQLFTNLDSSQAKQLAKALVRIYLSGPDSNIFQNETLTKNRMLLNALILEINKNIMKLFENGNTIAKSMNKTNFEIITFLQNENVRDYFTNLTMEVENHKEYLIKYTELLRIMQIHNLDETYQLTTIFVLLAVKKCCKTKKLRRNIDQILQSTFELSPKYPDLFKIFPVDYIFSFEDNLILNLFTLSIKTANSQSIVRSTLEAAVKKVKTNSEIVKNLVDILLSKRKLAKKKSVNNLEYFSDTMFQLQCIILPIIAKEKRAITASAFRSILADLQERLHQAILESFMVIDFTKIGIFGNDDSGNIDDSSVASERNAAIFNAIGAYSLTLLKYCEMTDLEEIKQLDCLWSGLEFFVQNAIEAIKNPKSKNQHIDSSIQLLNIILRYIKKLDSHELFKNKDALFKQIWQSIKFRLLLLFDERSKSRLNKALFENISVTLKFLAELSSIECFMSQFVGDISSLANLKKPSEILKNEEISNSELTSHRTSKYLLQNCLKANIIAPKCIGIKKLIFRNCKTIKCWIQEHFETNHDGINGKKTHRKYFTERNENLNEPQLTVIKVKDAICKLLRLNLDMLAEVVMAAKKIPLDYRFLDTVFEVQHLVHYILGRNSIDTKCEISWQSFFGLHEGCVVVLNNLLLAREELLEDRWPCYMQCYKTLILCLCERANTLEQIDRETEQKLAETAHFIEKLTQSICKRKAHVSRIAAYAIADICTWIEKTTPPKLIRQHLENSIALLIQTSDSTYAMAFLRRALAGSIGQMTMSNMYSVYKRYHKYVGNA